MTPFPNNFLDSHMIAMVTMAYPNTVNSSEMNRWDFESGFALNCSRLNYP